MPIPGCDFGSPKVAKSPVSLEVLDQLDQIERFFAFVTSERIEVVIPSQVLAEFLVRNAAEEREQALALVDPSFPIAPLNFGAA